MHRLIRQSAIEHKREPFLQSSVLTLEGLSIAHVAGPGRCIACMADGCRAGVSFKDWSNAYPVGYISEIGDEPVVLMGKPVS
jgi:hypothetical protein